MDTSETYIKMCKGAYGDLGIPDGERTHFHGEAVWEDVGGDAKEIVRYDLIPLWGQDQLQEMLGDNGDSLRLVWRFYDWLKEDYQGELKPEQYDSMEQLWLAFVMKEKYNKIWNGEDWVKEE